MQILVERAWLEGLQKYGKELEAELDNLDTDNVKELRLKGRIARAIGYVESVDYILENNPPQGV